MSKVNKENADTISVKTEVHMAKIIDSNFQRRIIQMTTDDIMSVVREYQRIVPRGCSYDEVRNCLNDTIIYIPEDV